FTQQEEINKEQWALVTSKAGRVASPDKIAVECASPNGFQLLQNLREEGEIDDDEEVEEVNSETTGNVDETDAVTEVNGDQNGGKSLTDTSLSLDLATTETEAERNVAGVTRRQHSSHRGRGKGAKRPIDVVEKCDMVDLAQVGPSFTWTNCQEENPISKKLDRVMVNSCWISSFPQSFVSFESGGVSDHLRMHTQLRDVPQGNMKPFKFFTHLTNHPRFLEVVARVWNESEPIFHSRSALRKLQEKLKALKFELRGLNRDMYGDLPGRVKQAYEELCARQTEAMQNPQ
ncbi:hypothetical protein HID58_014112, partial [Brassica napus]